MNPPPETPTTAQERQFLEMLDRILRERAEADAKRKKAYLDGAAIAIALAAAIFTGWQAWEAHEARREASQASSESLQISQRAYIGVDGIAAQNGPRLNIKTFGNSPALKVFIESNCYLPSGGGGGSWGDGDDQGPIIKPDGEILTPGTPYSLDCYNETIKKKFINPPDADFTYLKGSVNYQDIFQKSHTTKFCFYRDERPGNHLHVCATGNTVD